MALAFGVIGGVISFLFLAGAIRGLLLGKLFQTGMCFLGNFLVIAGTLLATALLWPEKLGWTGAALAAMLLLCAVVNGIVQARRNRNSKERADWALNHRAENGEEGEEK